MPGSSRDVLTRGMPNAFFFFFLQPISSQVDQALHSLKLLVQLSVHDTGYFGDKSMLGEASYVYVAQFKQGSLHVPRRGGLILSEVITTPR